MWQLQINVMKTATKNIRIRESAKVKNVQLQSSFLLCRGISVDANLSSKSEIIYGDDLLSLDSDFFSLLDALSELLILPFTGN